MAISLADQYYLKAVEDYDYCLEETVESLNYALSYDPEHVGANHLMGRLLMDRFQKFEEAEQYFVTAMSNEPQNLSLCESYIWLYIKNGEYEKAYRLVNYTLSIRGVIVSEVLRLKALAKELQREWKEAKAILEEAILACYDNSYLGFLEGEIERIDKKVQRSMSVCYSF